jgi:homoserine kinase
VRAFAPGSIGNLGPGLDILGCALTGAGDVVHAWRTSAPGVHVEQPGHPDLPRDATLHASAIAAADVLRRAGSSQTGIALSVEKGLPLSGGQGGSSASAVAGAVAANALLGDPLDRDALLLAALAAEERVAGRHLDNIAPTLVGGIVLVRSIDPIDIVRLPVPDNLYVVLVHPEQRLATAKARSVLPASVDRPTALAQASAVAGMIAAFYANDLALLGRSVDDRIAEPARASLLPGFVAAKRAALAAGALGASISGSGPTAFALVQGTERARAVAEAMHAAYAAAGISAQVRVDQVDRLGARVVR